MLVKIEIKSIWGKILFSAEKEDYTIAKALSDAVLRGADLSDAVLRGADLSSAVLSSAVLSDAVLRGADLSSAVLSDAVLRGADLSSAVLRDADLSSADLSDADLRGADLSDAVLRGADLSDADLRGADLSSAVLSDADLRDAVLRGADLRGAKVTGKELKEFQELCSRDMLYVFRELKHELPYLREKLLKGEVEGTQYDGECACLLGTLAHGSEETAKQFCVKGTLPFYTLGLQNPCEQWFWNIREGDTPENSLFAKVALELIDMVMKEGTERAPAAVKMGK